MRVATAVDVDTVAGIIALAFADDPTWGPALQRADGSTAHHRDFWRLFVQGALRHDHIFVSDDDAAIALWIPPGADEMTDDQVEQLSAIVTENLEPDAQDAMFALWERFEEAQPQDEPHAYLSLLATHPDARGRGIAQDLLRQNLADFDRQGLATYLESTNPANDHRYERAGFAKIGAFEGFVPGTVVSTMWRPAS